MNYRHFFAVLLLLLCVPLAANEPAAHAALANIGNQIAEANITATISALTQFVTRNTLSCGDKADFGIGGARRWLQQKFAQIPGLIVNLDCYKLAAQGGRLTKPVELCNVIATLPGSAKPERIIIVDAHYDSFVLAKDGDIASANADTPAPGANDDGSGIAAMLEMARILSPTKPHATIMFVAFAGEEQGLVGSTLLAKKLRAQGKNIIAVFTMDMIGNVNGGSGYGESNRVRLFSEGPADSSARELARYAYEIGHTLFPAFNVDLIFRNDRFGRGGDHTPFVAEGYPGIRFTEAQENYSRQHTTDDTLANMSPAYCAAVARIVIAAVASLAAAPAQPDVNEADGKPMIGRGAGYDAHLRWRFTGDPLSIKGFKVYVRDTKAPLWQQTFWAGTQLEWICKNLSIDDYTFGVSVVSTTGFESPITPYVMQARKQVAYKLQNEL